MKNLASLLLIACCVTMASCGSDYKLTVYFPNHDFDGKKAYLTNYDTGDTIDSVNVFEKQLLMEGNVDTAYFARLLFEDNRLDLVIEQGEIEVEWGVKLNISGTPLNIKFNRLVKQLERYDVEWQQIARSLQQEQITESEAQQQEDERKTKLLKSLYNNYLSNKDNVIGEWCFIQYIIEGDFTSSELKLLLKKVPEQYRRLERVKNALKNAEAKEKTGEGQRFVDFDVLGNNGVTEKLSQYAGDGINYTLVYFMASWCSSCRKEIEGPLTYLYENYKEKGLKIVGVAVWDKPADTNAAIAEMSIPWHVMVGDHYMTAPADSYGIAGIPYAIVVAPDGTILNRGLNGDALIKAVEAQFVNR